MPLLGGIRGSQEACSGEACAIQTCLAKNNYMPEKCKRQIEDLQKCCEKYQVTGSQRGVYHRLL